MIQLDTLWLIKQANEKKLNEISNQLHLYSRRYMKIDLEFFLEILNCIDNEEDEKILEIFENKKYELAVIKDKIIQLKEIVIGKVNEYEPIS